MTAFEMLSAGKIRFVRGVRFDGVRVSGFPLVCHGETEISGIVAAQAESYESAVFVRFDEQVPATVPQDNPAHCWASQLCIEDRSTRDCRPVGIVIVWSSDEIEAAHREAKRAATEISFDEFNVRRHGAPLVEG